MPRERCSLLSQRSPRHADAHSDPHTSASAEGSAEPAPLRRSRRPAPRRSRSLTLLPSAGRVPPAPGCTRRDTAAPGAGHGHGQAWARCAALALGTITGELGRFGPRRAQLRRAMRGVGGDTSGAAPSRPRRSPVARRHRGRAAGSGRGAGAGGRGSPAQAPRCGRAGSGPVGARFPGSSRAAPAAVPAPGAGLQLAGAPGRAAPSRPPVVGVAEPRKTRCGLGGGRGCPGAGRGQPGDSPARRVQVFSSHGPSVPHLAGDAQRKKMLGNTH